MPFDVDIVRAEFPALDITDRGRRRIYFDNPAGTQVPQRVIDSMAACLTASNANLGGYFETSQRAEAVVDDAHEAVADLLNAESAEQIVFGQNMTSLTFQMSRSIGRALGRGDEIVLSRMDHDANVQPWMRLAAELGLEIRWLGFDPASGEFDLDDLDRLLNRRTRLVCVGAASNLIGTINDVAGICRRARGVGAWTYIDAVQAAPHVRLDVQALSCDFLVVSAYKFCGPHQGAQYGRRELLASLDAYKVRSVPDELPGRFETGTQSHEGMAGTAAAVDYLAWIGETMAQGYQGAHDEFDGRRRHVRAAMDCLFDYEQGLTSQLVEGLESLPDVRVLGIRDPDAMHRRVPTVSFTHDKMSPASIARMLADEGIFVWSGDNYAVEAADVLGLPEGAVRVGPAHYNRSSEIDELLDVLRRRLG